MLGTRKIPHVKLNVNAIADLAEMRGFYVVDAERKGMVYVAAENEIMICTANNGYIRLRSDVAETMARELLDILVDLRDLGRIKNGKN